MGTTYDPWLEVDRLGLEVHEKRLPNGWRGAYDHGEKAIFLARGLSIREARSTLAHEIQHALAGDVPSKFGLINVRQELRARRATALALVDADEYRAAEILRGAHFSSIAYELNVTNRVLTDWISLIENQNMGIRMGTPAHFEAEIYFLENTKTP